MPASFNRPCWRGVFAKRSISPSSSIRAIFRPCATAQEKNLRKAVDASPDSYRARIALARFTDSEEQALRAVEIDATRVDAYAILAAIYADRADWEKLDGILAAATKNVPDDLTPYYRAAERLVAKRRALNRAAGLLKTYLSQPPEGNQPTIADAQRLIILTSHEEHTLHGDRGGWPGIPVRLA
jgi:hypothetical protein